MNRFIGLTVEEAIEVAKTFKAEYGFHNGELWVDWDSEAPFYEFEYTEDGKICEWVPAMWL